MIRSIVLTGGPGAGKTCIAQRLAIAHPQRIVLAPVAATLVYARLGQRWDELDDAGRCQVQRHIYQLQIEQEQRARQQHPDSILLADRGTVDGSAYWPHGPDDYWRDLGVSRQAELARYDAVIWLESSAAIGLYDGDATNACRFEDTAGAIACGQRLAEVWQAHPRFFRVPAQPTIEDKTAAVNAIVFRLAPELNPGHPAAARSAQSPSP